MIDTWQRFWKWLGLSCGALILGLYLVNPKPEEVDAIFITRNIITGLGMYVVLLSVGIIFGAILKRGNRLGIYSIGVYIASFLSALCIFGTLYGNLMR